MRKIVLIGAGSVVFTQGLVVDLIRSSREEGWNLALVDIDEKALDTAVKITQKMIRATNANIVLTYSTDRCDVLAGADYVVTTIGVGGRRAWEQDVFIPRKYGIYQPVGDSVMPGGISRAMRMIPAMLDITKDVMRLCPDARLFNYSNPMTYICRAIRKATGFPVIGLCHGTNHTEESLAKFAGFDRKDVTTYVAGLNHMTFITHFYHKGKDAWPKVREKISAMKDSVVSDEDYAKQYYDREPFCWELFETYGAFPAPGDRHVTEFFPERFPGGSYYGKVLGKDAFSFEGTIEAGDKKFEQMVRTANDTGPLDDDFFAGFSGEHEQLLDIIHSMENDERKVFAANLPNNGAIANLPKDAVLEISACATAKGLLPLQQGNIPDTLAGILLKHLAIAEVVVDAALTGNRNLFVESVMMGGYISNRKTVEKMVDELLHAQKQYLPQFV